MHITITFDTWEELEQFRGGKDAPTVVVPVTQVQQDTEQIKEMLKDPVKAVEKIIDAPAAPKVDKPTARKVLADLNKKAGTNRAAELIKAAGYGKLTDVPDEALAGIVEEAKKLMEVM